MMAKRFLITGGQLYSNLGAAAMAIVTLISSRCMNERTPLLG
jgi:hypothetical protein